ncbi:MAG: TRAP transporter large permease [Gammaproteobacteria bacterium]|jgi:tripartite ATP-independent transporter DctM subunit|nr:TRAP transporter large permease [Gammaproteobacteria bacterium]MBT3722047.1 TRAP transporter large permease [Gammaproteobacteria bacterium]MBT4078805.1 TRAP transporter large permease [Gammaproteobacteria bacterium]MBT4195940.1 TRAP transporter large permease [Gammaproteobacteria bacterium]MBT4451588.1 TRAP transporter large permease [Gammaproteobacteria bacterium]
MSISIIGFVGLLILILLRTPISFAMAFVGFFGFLFLNDFNWIASLSMASRRIIDTSQDYGLSVIPLFILMGNLVTKAGLSKELYKASYSFLGHLRGGLSMATIVACGGFSAICGSSLATAATMAKVSMPPMRRYGYSDSLAAASIAAGGTLGILIPPSVILVIYGIMSEQSIRELFAAGFIPGMLGVLLYLGAVYWTVWRNPEAGPRGERMNTKQRVDSLKGVWGILLLFGIVMGGIYGGVFTPTEAAGIGAAGAFIIALLRKSLTIKNTFNVLYETAATTSSLFMVIIGALIFSTFITRAGLPDQLLQLITGNDISPMMVIFMILGIYILLGCVFESLSMLLLTIPIFYPVVESLGFDLIWFGIVVVVVTEISLITPPVGLNVFVLSGVLKDVKTATIFKGVTPFWVADIIRLSLITLIPAISLILPQWLYH